jgi:hypothetical protein
MKLKQLVRMVCVLSGMLLLLPENSSAQVVNIENKRIYDDTAGWSGSVSGTFSAMQTRDLLLGFNFKPLVQYKTRKHYYLLIGDMTYSKGEEVYANSAMAHFRYAYRLRNSAWKWESYAQVQYNELLNQRLRALAGTGLRWKFYDNKTAKYFFGSSVFYEYEEVRPDDQINQGLRWSNYLSWLMNKEHFSFSAATYYQPLFANFKDFRISGQYTLLFKFVKRTDFKFEVTAFYDSYPAENVRNFVFNATFGVQLRLG